MPTITYVLPDGSRRSVTGRPGSSLMETAVQNGVPGIVAECGGACACATCHIYVDEDFQATVGSPGEWEEEMLEEVVSPRRVGSRLSCQITISDAVDGIAVAIPPAQQ
jgi:Ferredoxin